MIYFFVFIILISGLYFSYTDLTRGIIPNRALLLLLFPALYANLGRMENLLFLPVLLLISFFLYCVGFWRAGDGKLFMCYSLFLLPFSSEHLHIILSNLFLAISLCYITLFLFLFPGLLRKRRISNAISAFGISISRKNLLKFLMIILLLFALMVALPEFFFRRSLPFLLVLLFALTYFSNTCTLFGKSSTSKKKTVFAPFLFLSTLILLLSTYYLYNA